ENAPALLRLQLLGANPSPRFAGLEELPSKSNYFIGNDPKKWHTNITNYGKVKYEGVYPGVDMVYYGNQRELEYDLVLHPGADPNSIRLRFEGAERVEVDENDLVLHTAVGEIRQRRPRVYQEVDGVKQAVACDYLLKGKREVGFQLAAYDQSKPLII